jgi:hypothetical protein
MKTEAEIDAEIRYTQGYLAGLLFTGDKPEAESKITVNDKFLKETAEIKRLIHKSHLQNIGWVALMLAVALALTHQNEFWLLALAPLIIGIALFVVACYDIDGKKWHWGWI